MQRDPLGYEASPNLHEYGAASPCVYIDPLGLVFKVREEKVYNKATGKMEGTGKADQKIKELMDQAEKASGLKAIWKNNETKDAKGQVTGLFWTVEFRRPKPPSAEAGAGEGSTAQGTQRTSEALATLLLWFMKDGNDWWVLQAPMYACRCSYTQRSIFLERARLAGNPWAGEPDSDFWSGLFAFVHECGHARKPKADEQDAKKNPLGNEKPAIDAENEVRKDLGWEKERTSHHQGEYPGKQPGGPGTRLR